MKRFQTILRSLRQALIWFFGLYWVMFIAYTIKNLVEGGPHAVVIWYRHISGGAFRWDWRVFLAQQVTMLAITLLLWFFGRRPTGHEATSNQHERQGGSS
jgi:hypothetical protein